MNKRKTGFLVGTMVLASLAVIKWICLNQLTQERHNRRTEGDIARIQEEIGAVYEHIEALSKEREEG